MTAEVIVEVVAIAVGLGFAAVPVVMLALVIAVKQPPSVSGSFLAGWALGLLASGVVVILLADAVSLGLRSQGWVSPLKAVLGVVLLLLAFLKWRKRPAPGEDRAAPAWVTAAESITPRRALGLGALLAVANPKQLVPTIAGAAVIAGATPRPAEQAVLLVVFVLVASIGIALPAVVNALPGAGAARMLERADVWITAHGSTVIVVVLAALGVLMLFSAFAG